MDFATIVGLLGAAGLIALPMIQGGDPGAFGDLASVQIVLGGSVMVVLLRSSLAEFKNALNVAGKVFSNKLPAPEELITQLVEFAAIARKDGKIALEGQEISYPFMSKAVAMLVDGAEEDMIKKSLRRDIEIRKIRHKQGASIFQSWGDVAPAMGMIGTLVGLVQMLGNMSDPKSIGPAMAVALLTTMYGAILANVFCIPIAMKLTNQAEIEATNCELILEGTLFIQAGGNPRILTDLLISFVAPKERLKLIET